MPSGRTTAPLPRGRHAPPLHVRLDAQRERLFAAAAAVFTRVGYADATAEAIAREAGMSKATFYEHFANKEECILALFDAAAQEVLAAMRGTSGPEPEDTYEDHLRGGVKAFLETIAGYPLHAQTVLVEVIGAGPRATERRDAILDAFADWLYKDNAANAPRFGAPVFADRADAFLVVGATVEVVSRQLRSRTPADILELERPLMRLLFGLLAQGRSEGL